MEYASCCQGVFLAQVEWMGKGCHDEVESGYRDEGWVMRKEEKGENVLPRNMRH